MAVRFSFGSGFDPRELEQFVATARAADEAGMTMVGTGDTPALLGDCYIGMSQIALHTSRCRVSSWITNPVTRHPVVIASALSTVNAFSGGRVVMGLSSGDSGVYNLGARPATLAQIEDTVRILRELWDTGVSTYQGERVRLTWGNDRIPIYLAPGGPKGLRLAGRIADGVFVEAGVMPDVAEDALAQIEAGARESGRTLEDLDIWWHVRAALGETREAAEDVLRSPLAGIANRRLRFGEEGKLIPDALLPQFRELKARYDIAHHEESGAQVRNGGLIDELGLREYLLGRFGIAGTPQDWVTRLHELEARGINQIALAVMMEDKVGFVKTLGAEVMPAVNA